MLTAIIIGTWSNHFDSGFHLDDQHTIVKNPAIRDLENVPRFFTDPLLFSTQPENADYRPVLTTLFAVDYSLSNGANASFFQGENFAWLLIEVVCVYLLFAIMPGVKHTTALLAAGLCAIHPVLADVVNYPLQRGSFITGAGLCLGFALWLFWPRMLPRTLPMKFYQFPRKFSEEALRWAHPYLSTAWDIMLKLPLPFYFIPVVFAMLAEPSAAVFPLILVAWIILFEGGAKLWRVLPSAIVCGGYWLFQTIWILKLGSVARLPAGSYLYTQPWVVVRFLMRFIFPVNLNASLDLQVFSSPLAPLAMAGYAGLGLLMALAVFTARRESLRYVSFGLWWFLITLLPRTVIPQLAASGDERMVVPLIGLAFAFSAAALLLVRRLRSSFSSAGLVEGCAWAAACLLIVPLALETYGRNPAWLTDDTLWGDIASKNPENGQALLNYGELMLGRGDLDRGMDFVNNGAARLPNDPHAEIVLAQAYSHMGRDADAERHFTRALALGPRLASNFSMYSQWLNERQRTEEAIANARKALALEGTDVAARHIVMEDLSRHFKWEELTAYANATLRIAPQDERTQGMIPLARLALDKIADAEKRARSQRTVDNFLYLSVVYFQNQRYAEAVKAARTVIEIDPKLPHGYANIAAAYYAMGKLDDSIGALESVVRLNPNMPGARNLLQSELSEKNTARR